MLKKIMMAGIAVGALALNAPIASADHVTADCGFESLQQDDVTGQTYQGGAYGIAVNSEGGSTSINCKIYVNGAYATETGTQTGTPVAVTAKDISFNADDDDVVTICAVYDNGHGNPAAVNCGTADHQEIPPAVVYETIDGVLNTYVWPTVDPIICEGLKAAQPGAGPIVINHEGDVWVDGMPFFDCPEYNMDWDGDGQPG